MSELKGKASESGLTINFKRTKRLVKKHDETVTKTPSKDDDIETVTQATYLGQQIAFENRTEIEINTRISKAWSKYWSLKYIFKGPFKNHHKSQVFNMCVIPSLTYGCQTLPLTVQNLNKIKVAQNSIERSMLNLKIKDKVKLSHIKNQLCENINAVNHVRKLKWKWAGHVARLKDDRWTHKTTFWYLTHMKRKQGRQATRWSDDINNFLATKNFQKIASDRKEWDRLQETFAHFGPRIHRIN